MADALPYTEDELKAEKEYCNGSRAKDNLFGTQMSAENAHKQVMDFMLNEQEPFLVGYQYQNPWVPKKDKENKGKKEKPAGFKNTKREETV